MDKVYKVVAERSSRSRSSQWGYKGKERIYRNKVGVASFVNVLKEYEIPYQVFEAEVNWKEISYGKDKET